MLFYTSRGCATLYVKPYYLDIRSKLITQILGMVYYDVENTGATKTDTPLNNARFDNITLFDEGFE